MLTSQQQQDVAFLGSSGSENPCGIPMSHENVAFQPNQRVESLNEINVLRIQSTKKCEHKRKLYSELLAITLSLSNEVCPTCKYHLIINYAQLLLLKATGYIVLLLELMQLSWKLICVGYVDNVGD